MGRLQSSLTFSQSKARVAESAGSNTAGELTRAGYAVCDAIRDWNNDEAWDFLQKRDTTLTVTSGEAAIPDDFKYIYGVTLSDGTPIYPISKQLEIINTYGSSSTGTPSFYTLYNSGYDTQTISIVPAPSDGTGVYLYYHRSLAIPTADGDILDILSDYEGYLIAHSKYLYLLDKNPEKAMGWKEVYEVGKRKAIAAERRRPTDNKILMPEGGLGLNTSSINIPDFAYWTGS